MKRVEQRQYEKGDCGVACIAMITGKSYEEVELAFHKHGLVVDGNYYTFHKHIIAVLDDFGYLAMRKKFITWDRVDYPAIVKINKKSNNYWHWVVLAGERNILDPKPGSPDVVTDYRGKKGDGQYLYVTKSS